MPSTLPYNQDNLISTGTAHVSTPVGTTTVLTAVADLRRLITGIVYDSAGAGTCTLQGLSGGASVFYINRAAAGASYFSLTHPILIEAGQGLEAVVATSAGTLSVVYSEV